MKSIKKIFWKKKKTAQKPAEKQSEETTDSAEQQQIARRVSVPTPERKKPKQLQQPRRHTEIVLASTTTPAAATRSDTPPPSLPKANMTADEAKAPPKADPGIVPGDHGNEPAGLAKAYDDIPVLEQCQLPRGGCSVDTKAVGRVQFGIPPETIKDSMRLGIPVPQVYIVPVERFCREMGPALGVNLAEFEFPAYFNFFVYQKRCTLVVDSVDAEENIRRVFSETLLGPAQFRRTQDPIAHQDEDFDPEYPREAMPNFEKELKHFRTMPGGKELVIETLLDFKHFEDREDMLGVPPPALEGSGDTDEEVAVQVGVQSDEEGVDAVPKDIRGVEKREEKRNPWTYTQTKEMGDVATVYPFHVTPEEIKAGKVARVEIFKMPGGTEYIVHDIDENNTIIGKARFSGHVKVSELIVEGFGGLSIMDDLDSSHKQKKDAVVPSPSRTSITTKGQVSSFHPPSFGVTILGNSHGFDSSGSVSGYVLWINGRGVMIDPPPYSSATLEREGIRPRTIVGIILTHCHADHDAGAFQKVLTGSPVVVITTPTIYKSFIRKYAALSALSPALLRHCHRYKPAIIGQPLRFQGATFHFMYSLHTIPCVGFRVEWRGRSMVFTADHFNNPPAIDDLQERGVLTKARADDLRNLPLQETDLILHEAGDPPIHTPIEVLMKLPQEVKDRLYVVHTNRAKFPEGCDLRVAPTGTAGTLRLDEQDTHRRSGHSNKGSVDLGEDDYSMWTTSSEYSLSDDHEQQTSISSPSVPNRNAKRNQRGSVFNPAGSHDAPPLVSMRPASTTDAWFILNLLSAVPFLSSLSYSSTMEVLETARVDAYALGNIVVPAEKRPHVLCVIWEGTCSERLIEEGQNRTSSMTKISEDQSPGSAESVGTVWHAGDWTGPISLQPEEVLSGESATSKTNDIVAMSKEGVKVITIDFLALDAVLKSGSALYRRFLERNAARERAKNSGQVLMRNPSTTELLLDDARKELNVLELLNNNYALRKLTAIQKRHLESLAVGPISFKPSDRLWGAGTPVDKAFIIISGTASFVRSRRQAGSEAAGAGQTMKDDAEVVRKEAEAHGDDHSSISSFEHEDHRNHGSKVVFDSMTGDYASPEYMAVSRHFQKRAEDIRENGSVASGLSGVSNDSEGDEEAFVEDGEMSRSRRNSLKRRRSSRLRQAQKVLGRLYSRRAFTGGLVFSRGHFLGDVSKMVAGLLSSEGSSEYGESGHQYGFGDKPESHQMDKALATITETSGSENAQRIMHDSTLVAGKDGCVVLVFPKSSLIPFLDEYPGLLLSLLGTQVVV